MSLRKSRYGWYDVVEFLLTVFPLACFQVQICRFLSGVLEASRADAFWKFTIATANCVCLAERWSILERSLVLISQVFTSRKLNQSNWAID